MTRPRILVADDDRRVRQLVGLTLDNEDFDLCYASDGREAIRIAGEVHPQLILLDYQMPDLSGVDVCRALRADPLTSRTPIVMLTGQGGEAIRELAFVAGVDDFLTKPFSPLSLERIVRAMLVMAFHPEQDVPAATAGAAPPPPAAAQTTDAEDEGGVLSREQLMLYASDLNRSMRELRQIHADLRKSYLVTIEALATALELRDAETQGHCKRVSLFTVAAARHIGIRDEALEQVRWGSVLHDVGKIGVPDAILLKPAKLLPAEWELIKRHPELGYRMLEAVPFLLEALAIVRFHHERYEGGGYPLGLRGDQIPLGARLFSVADTIDAMTVDRPYCKALPWEAAREEISRCRGTQFDPVVVQAYLEVFDRLPTLGGDDLA